MQIRGTFLNLVILLVTIFFWGGGEKLHFENINWRLPNQGVTKFNKVNNYYFYKGARKNSGQARKRFLYTQKMWNVLKRKKLRKRNLLFIVEGKTYFQPIGSIIGDF